MKRRGELAAGGSPVDKKAHLMYTEFQTEFLVGYNSTVRFRMWGGAVFIC